MMALKELFSGTHHVHPHFVSLAVFVEKGLGLVESKARSPASRANSIRCATVISAVTRSRQHFLLPAAFMFFIIASRQMNLFNADGKIERKRHDLWHGSRAPVMFVTKCGKWAVDAGLAAIPPRW